MPEKIYFTADNHFDHRKLISANHRAKFTSVDEMNECLIDNWNSLVKRPDRIYILGDMFLCKPERAVKILRRLNGHKFLILGNHDKTVQHALCRDYFVWQKDLHWFSIGQQKIMLCHYAMRSWRAMHHGSYMLFGHSHGKLDDIPNLRTMDVGVDCHNFYPVTYEQIKEKLDKRPLSPIEDERN